MEGTRLILPLCLALAWTACAGPGPRGRGGELGGLLARAAREQLGRPYRAGGVSPRGFDCSGLAWWVHHRHGVSIPRTSFGQFKAGRRVRRARLRPGDLVFFTTYRRGASHVGVYVGRNSFVHAPKSGTPVRYDNLSHPYWSRRYLGARRYR